MCWVPQNQVLTCKNRSPYSIGWSAVRETKQNSAYRGELKIICPDKIKDLKSKRLDQYSRKWVQNWTN
jgi:hypothetical protein